MLPFDRLSKMQADNLMKLGIYISGSELFYKESEWPSKFQTWVLRAGFNSFRIKNKVNTDTVNRLEHRKRPRMGFENPAH